MYKFTNGKKRIRPININKTKRFFKNVLAISSAVLVFFNSCPIYSVKAETVGSFIIEGGTSDTDYTYNSGVLTIKSSTPMTIKNTDPSTATSNRIEIDLSDGVSEANLTLAGVNIKATDGAAIKIRDDATFNVNIFLADGSENVLKGKVGSPYDPANPGIEKRGNADGVGKLTITGSTGENAGILEATGGYLAAGIGGGDGGSASNITISGGTVTATGGNNGAGIGGGYGYSAGGSASKIEISGGEITATGTDGGAGIGGGIYGNASNITITGGVVTATGGNNGAGIGGGYRGSASNITISGGEITATGTGGGAGIGSGCGDVFGLGEDNASNIEISGGTVTATGSFNGAGIGGGWGGNASNITITGGVVTATGGSNGAGIGGGNSGTASDNIINGDVVVIATSGGKPALEGFDSDSGDSLAKGIVFERQTESGDWTGTMYGDEITITEDVTFPADLTIEDGKTLIVNSNAELTINDGAIKNRGTLDGTINCNGNGVVKTEVTYNESDTEDMTSNVEYKTYQDSNGIKTYENLPTPTREGYDFEGWYTEADGGTQVKEDAQVMPNLHVLYAHWKENEDSNTNISMNYFEPKNETNKNDESNDFIGNEITQKETYTLSQIKVPEYLKSRVFVNGYLDRNFIPENSITRAEAAAMLYKLMYDGTQIDTNILEQYNDVEKNDWSTAAIAYLSQHKIIQGFDGEFRPNDKITRAEFSKIVYESLLSYNANENSKLIYGENEFNFSDVKNDWSFEPIKQLATNDIINGYENDLFKPNENITRAETVKIINKAFGRSENWIGAINFNDVNENHWAYKFIMNATNGKK